MNPQCHQWMSDVHLQTLTCRLCGMTVEGGIGVKVGDLMRISVALIKDIAEQPDGQSPLVKVVDVRVESDGSKTLIMEKT